jgi:H+-transporting ATPase
MQTDHVQNAVRSEQQGLSSSEAAQRLAEFGPNAIVEKHRSALRKLLSYLWGPIPWMIEAAALLSGLARDWSDFAIILLMLLVNAGVAFWQEHKADNAIALLKQRLAARARVRRDGKWVDLAASQLVPGDIVHIALGNVVPADLKLLQGQTVSLDQSTLTGESLPAEKGVGDMAYSGSIVRTGEMVGEVTATGMKTFFGKTAALVEAAGAPSHFQKAVLQIGNSLIVATLALVAVVLVVAWLRGEPLLDTLKFALILTVAAIPVALPAVLSVTLAVGATVLSHLGAIVSRLAAIEELAGMDVLCSDKTGTLTQNKLTVGEPLPLADEQPAEILLYAALASQTASNDAIDSAVIGACGDALNQHRSEIRQFKPFDPVSKLTEAEVVLDGVNLQVAKGAPQAIVAWAKADAATSQRIAAMVDKLAADGYRALAVGRGTEDGQRQVIGLLPLFDPPRDDSAETIAALDQQGVAVRMVTGDHVAIARQIGHRLGMDGEFVTVDKVFVGYAQPSAEALLANEGYAQVFPEHKYKIVQVLQGGQHFVGMTGDGVNDAPALRQADVGIAVSGATDAARAAADLVLTEPGLGVIRSAIEQSREIFQRMNAYAVFRISETIRVMLFMTLSILVFKFYPVTAVMIVLLALLNDFPIMMIAYDNAVASPRPVRWNMRHVLVLAVVLGLLGVVSSFSLFWLAESVWHLPRTTIQTMIFLKLLVAGHLTLYLARNTGHFWDRPWPSLKLFVSTELTQVAGTLAAVYGWFVEPIGWSMALAIWGYAFAWFLFNNMVKRMILRRMALLD